MYICMYVYIYIYSCTCIHLETNIKLSGPSAKHASCHKVNIRRLLTSFGCSLVLERALFSGAEPPLRKQHYDT